MKKQWVVMLLAACLCCSAGHLMAAEGSYRDIDTRWKALGDTHAERQQVARDLRAQYNAYLVAKKDAKGLRASGKYDASIPRSLAAAQLTNWSWVAAWRYNDAAYALILKYDAGQGTVKDLVQAGKYLDQAIEALTVARACDICLELRGEAIGNIRACEEKVGSNREYIKVRTQGVE